MKIPEFHFKKRSRENNPDTLYITFGVLCLFLATYLFILPVQAVPVKESGDFFSGVFMTEKEPGTISVRWITEGENDNFNIRYHLNGTESDEKNIGNSSIIRQNITGQTLYSAEISGLYPGCRIFGRLLKEGNFCQPFSFQIPDKKSGFEFVVLSDLHSSPENQENYESLSCNSAGYDSVSQILKTITDCINSNDDPSFVVITGDLVNDGYLLPEWKEFFVRASPLLNKTVLYTTPGNHEKNSTFYYDFFGYPQFYSTQTGGCGLVFLDSNDNAAVTFPLQKELITNLTGNTDSQKESHLNFIFFHHPPYSSDERHPGGWKNIRKAWGESIENTVNPVVFSGHVHAYERFETRNATYIVSGTGGGELYSLGTYPDENNLPERSIENEYGYMKVRVPAGGNYAEISFISPAISDNRDIITESASGEITRLPGVRIRSEVLDYSVAGNRYGNNQFMEKIMRVTENYPFLFFSGG